RANGRGGRATATRNHHGLHEFVGHALFIAVLQRRNRIAALRLRLAVSQRAVSQLDALPAIVAVHGVIAPDHGSDFTDAQLAHFLLQLADVIPAAVWRGVAA